MLSLLKKGIIDQTPVLGYNARMESKTKCSVIALVGQPNVGKSTLLNAIVGQKISITTHKAQTTRYNIRGAANLGDAQLVFIDTPGLFDPKKTLEKAIVKEAINSFDECDAICLIIDSVKIDEFLPDQLKTYLSKNKKKCFAILNKVDLIKNRDSLLPIIKQVYDTGLFEEVFPISASKGLGVDKFMQYFANKAEEGPWMFLNEEFTDTPVRKIAQEITREKAFILMHEEIPYSLKVETETWQEMEDGSVKIYQAIFVNKEAHKSMILGKAGGKIKEIGTRARRDISRLLGQKVHLYLHVKVREDWMEKDLGF